MKIAVSLLSLSLTFMLVSVAISPILPDIAKSFPDEGESYSKLFLTLPSLIVIPFVLLAGYLSKLFEKRKLIFFGLILYLISGIGSMLSFNSYVFMFFRALVGISAGLIVPYSSSLITDYFSGEKRYRLLSYVGLIGYFGGIIILISAGLLANIHWRIAFLVYLIPIVPLVLLYKFLPKMKKKKISLREKQIPFLYYYNFPRVVWKYCFFNLILSILGFVFFSNVSFLIKFNHIGGPTEIGITQSFFMFGGMISNFFMHKLKIVTGSFLHVLQMLFISQGFFLLAEVNIGLMLIYFAGILIGLGYGSVLSSMTTLVTENTTPLKRIYGIAAITGSMYLGQFLSPVIFGFIERLFNIQSQGAIFIIVGVVFALFAFVVLFRWIKSYSKLTR